MNPLIWLTCPLCGTTTDTPHLTADPHPTGYHIRARCPHCGKHIKWVSKSLFSAAQIIDLCAKSGIAQKGDIS